MSPVLAVLVAVGYVTGIAGVTIAAVRLGDRRWARRTRLAAAQRRPRR